MAAESKDEGKEGELRDLKGTQSFMPAEQIEREYIADTLRRHFKTYGYRPVETSILEFYDIAASKYGGGAEILKETYKLKDQGERSLCLRYELTFKLAKLVGMNPNVRMPFKRYEIGKVFRDGPVSTGRLREFTQCDVDVVGTKSPMADSELMALAFSIFRDLGIGVYIEVNSRSLLFGIFKQVGIHESKYIDAALSIDKLPKVGEASVREEMLGKGFSKEAIEGVFEIMTSASMRTSNMQRIEYVEESAPNDLAKKGAAELKEMLGFFESMGVKGDLRITPSLARGLGYYTGIMYEVYAAKGSMKSALAGGGRWDNLIMGFLGSKREYPATGIAFGLDAIYAALKDTKKAEPETDRTKRVPMLLVIPIGTMAESLKLLQQARDLGMSADLLPDKGLMKALEYANKESIPYALILGKEELSNGTVKLRDMETGKESEISLNALKSAFEALNEYGKFSYK